MVYRTTPRMATRKEARRSKFLRTALEMFGKQGYHATTVPMIVRKSGSSTGAFYFYFKNKEDVFAAALEAVGEEVAETLNRALAKVDNDVLRQMATAVDTLVHYLALHPAQARILIIESSGLTPRLAKVRRAIIASHCRSVEKAIVSLALSGTCLNPKVAATCWVGAILESMYEWLETPLDQRISPKVLAKNITRFNLRGISAKRNILP